MAAGLALMLAPAMPVAGQTGTAAPQKPPAWTHPKTPWGDPDLQGMWPTEEMTGVPLQPEYVVIHIEMIHEACIIPVDGRPHLPSSIKTWLGDSRGHWEGNTLVVETTNFNGKTAATNPGTSGSPMDNNIPTSEAMRIVERFARVDAGTINYKATVDDPTIFTRTWKVALPLRRNPDDRIYDYACHENNYALLNFIRGSQFQRAQKPKQ
jgi:hypothetical protein